MKLLSKIAFAVYLLILLWLVLFKFSLDLPAVLDYQIRTLNLIPFTGFSRGNFGEMFYNFLVFIPFGLLLSINLKRTNLWRGLAFIFIFSLGVEITQFIFAIGTTDITDVITNTFGGLLGLMVYELSRKHIHNKKLDQSIIAIGAILFIVLVGILLSGTVKFQAASPPKMIPPQRAPAANHL